MARLHRLCPIGIPQHIVQRGNNRQVCFNGNEDMAAYAGWLKGFSAKFQVEIHAWVFMTNHVHLLVTPRAENGISKMMQALGRQYVRYFIKPISEVEPCGKADLNPVESSQAIAC